MLRSSLTLACVVFAAGAVAQEALPFAPAPEIPAVFETTAAPGPGARARSKGSKPSPKRSVAAAPSSQLAGLISHHANANGVPADLAHRVIMRESRYNPSARNKVYWGLMQISHATARGVGYRGPAQGLLDPDTNLRYGMAYLGNAYRVAGGDQRRAMKLYASGFYYEAKRKGMLGQLRGPAEAPQVATR